MFFTINKPNGDRRRIGSIRERSQTVNPNTNQWVKSDIKTGRFIDAKKDGTPFKDVRKER